MATIGTTTATAILPDCDNPPDVSELSASPVANAAAPEEEDDDLEDEEASVNDGVDGRLGGAVEVTMTTEGASLPPVDDGFSVITDVTRTTALVRGGAADVRGMMELGGIANDEAGAEGDVVGSTNELDAGWEVAAREVAISDEFISIISRYRHKCTHQWHCSPYWLDQITRIT
jgi:hypothetical protein